MVSKENIKTVLKTLHNVYNDISMLASFTDKSPFQILVATVLSARSRDEQIIKIVPELFRNFPDPKAMSKAQISTLERLVKQSGFYKVKARRIRDLSRQLVTDFNGEVPETMDELLSLPGVGRKTAGCVLVYAYKKPAIPVDTHVHRVVNRLGWVKTNLPEKTETELMEIVPHGFWLILNEVMVLHGRKVCQPITPYCSKCIIEKHCKKTGVTKSK